jgi:hypothetical protein
MDMKKEGLNEDESRRVLIFMFDFTRRRYHIVPVGRCMYVCYTFTLCV